MKTGLLTLLAIVAMMLAAPFAQAGAPQGFDTDEFAQFSNVTVPVGAVQDSSSLHKGSKKHVHDNSFNEVIALGLSPTEMKNLGVDSGQNLTVEARNKSVTASVYKVSGAAKPPTATVNLSVAAARKLGVRAGDEVFIHRPGDGAMPQTTKKADTVTTTGKMHHLDDDE